MSVRNMIPGWLDKSSTASDSKLLQSAKEQEHQIAVLIPKLERFIVTLEESPDNIEAPEVREFATGIDTAVLEIFDIPSLEWYDLSREELLAVCRERLAACRERRELVGLVKELHSGASVGAVVRRQVSGFAAALLSRSKPQTVLNGGIDDRALGTAIRRYDQIGTFEQRLAAISEKSVAGGLNSLVVGLVYEEIAAQRKLAESALARESGRLLGEMGDTLTSPPPSWAGSSAGRGFYQRLVERQNTALRSLQETSKRTQESAALVRELESESSPSGRLTCLLRMADFIGGLSASAPPTRAEGANESDQQGGITPSVIADTEAKVESVHKELRASALEAFDKAWNGIKETILASNDHAGDGVLAGLERELADLQTFSSSFPNERDFNQELQARIRTLSTAIEHIRELQKSIQSSVVAVDTALTSGVGSSLAGVLSSLQQQMSDRERFLASPEHAISSLSDRAESILRTMRELETRMEELRSRAPLALDPSLFALPPIVLAISQEVGRHWFLPGQRELQRRWDFSGDIVQVPQIASRISGLNFFLDERRLGPPDLNAHNRGHWMIARINDDRQREMPWPELDGPISAELLMQIFRQGNLGQQQVRALNVRVAGLVAAQESVDSMLSLPSISLLRGTLEENAERVRRFEQALQKRDEAMSALWQQLERHDVHPAMALPEIPELQLPKQPIYSSDSSTSAAGSQEPFDLSGLRDLRSQASSFLRELGQDNPYMRYGYDEPRAELGQSLQDMVGQVFLADLFRRADTDGLTVESQDNILRQADFVLSIHVGLACRVLDAISTEDLGGQIEQPLAHELRRRSIALAMQNLQLTMDRARAYRQYLERKLYPEPVAMPNRAAV